MQFEEITISAIVALIIAYSAVYFDRWLGARQDYRQRVQGLKAEVRENQNRAREILVFTAKELELLKSQKYSLGVVPRLSVEVWKTVYMRGYPLKFPPELRDGLQLYYRFVGTINIVERSREKLIFGTMIEGEPFYNMLRKVDESTMKILQEYLFRLGKEVDELIKV